LQINDKNKSECGRIGHKMRWPYSVGKATQTRPVSAVCHVIFSEGHIDTYHGIPVCPRFQPSYCHHRLS